MTKVTPYAQKAIPTILINDQELSVFESISHANPMDTHNEEASSNPQSSNIQENFCEFNKAGKIFRRQCHHITCQYKRNNLKNSITLEQSATNSENLEISVSIPSLSSEKDIHDQNAQRRWNAYVAILRNDNIEFSWLKVFLYTFGIVFLGPLFTLPMTLVPVHDLVKHPEYWYEIFYHATLTTFGTCCLNCCLTGYFLNIDYTLKLKNIANITFIAILLVNLIVLASYYTWTAALEYQYPIPFLGIGLFCLMTFPFFIMIWFNFPKDWRHDNDLRNRMKYYIAFWVVVILTVLVARGTIDAISQYQAILVFGIISTREVFLWIETMVIQKTCDNDLGSSKTILQYYIFVSLSILSCNVISSNLSDVACWGLIGTDFCINVLKCFRFIWIRKRGSAGISDQIDFLQGLIMCELVEFQAPLSFMLTFICTYYSPNGHLFGNVLNGYWDFISTEDLNQKLYKWSLFFLADFSSMVVTAISLWHFCKINIFKALLDMQQEFWTGFVVILGSLLNHVS